MSASIELEAVLEPLSRCLDEECSRRVVALKLDESVQARMNWLAEQANEGSLDVAERAEYEALINAADFMAILRLKVGRRLEQAT